MPMAGDPTFEPFTLGGVTSSNRMLRSSVGGRMAHHDGTVSSVWKNFEERFADGGVGGISSTTLDVNRARESPLEYPPISDDRFIAPLRRYLAEIRATGCRYIIQIGDPGYATQTSLFPQHADGMSSSPGVDLIHGYRNRRTAMDEDEIERSIREFADAAGACARPAPTASRSPRRRATSSTSS
jgi:2,4-dienoyl-CoA reductase (NADPH2)